MDAYLEVFSSASGLLSLFTLVILEIVLGIDNIIFIAIICGYIPNRKDQRRARVLGLTLALVARIILLSTITWITKMQDALPWFEGWPIKVSGRGLILFAGGMFLIIKTITEIYHKFGAADKTQNKPAKSMTWAQAIFQITLIDIVFSFDSIITAVGVTADNPNASLALATMIMAVVLSMIVMLLFAPYVSDFIERFPTIKMLALAFLVVIGIILVIEALEDAAVFHLPEGVSIKTYAYIALAFSAIVEMLNIRLQSISNRKSGES